MARFSDFVKYIPFVDTIVEVISDVNPQTGKSDPVKAFADLIQGATPLLKANSPKSAADIDAASQAVLLALATVQANKAAGEASQGASDAPKA